jgi:hypothetical protein
LAEELADGRLLNRLGASRITVSETGAYPETLGRLASMDLIARMHCAIRDDRHLTPENESMEFVAGKAWFIAEQ